MCFTTEEKSTNKLLVNLYHIGSEVFMKINLTDALESLLHLYRKTCINFIHITFVTIDGIM